MPHLFLNKHSLFGLAGKGPWGRITHSVYVIRRYGLHLKTGVEDWIFLKTEGLPSNVSSPNGPGIEIPYVMGSPDVISEYPDCKDFFVSAFGSVRSRNRLVWIVCLTFQIKI